MRLVSLSLSLIKKLRVSKFHLINCPTSPQHFTNLNIAPFSLSLTFTLFHLEEPLHYWLPWPHCVESWDLGRVQTHWLRSGSRFIPSSPRLSIAPSHSSPVPFPALPALSQRENKYFTCVISPRTRIIFNFRYFKISSIVTLRKWWNWCKVILIIPHSLWLRFQFPNTPTPQLVPICPLSR